LAILLVEMALSRTLNFLDFLLVSLTATYWQLAHLKKFVKLLLAAWTSSEFFFELFGLEIVGVDS
jgi:hypothetical protein